MVTITVRLIRSFEHRNIKHIVFHDVSLDQTAQKFMEFINLEIKNKPGIPPPFRKYPFDTLKIQHKAHGAKTSDPVINTENDETLILDPLKSLQENHVEHETELSYFSLSDYQKYKANPELKWE